MREKVGERMRDTKGHELMKGGSDEGEKRKRNEVERGKGNRDEEGDGEKKMGQKKKRRE